MRNRWAVIVAAFGALAACSKGHHDETAATTGSGSNSNSNGSSAAIGSATSVGSAVAIVVDAGFVDAVVAEAPFFPDKLGPNEGIIVAEKQGGTVKGIPDGTKVEVVSVTEMMVGSPMTGVAKVKYNGKKVTLPPARVLFAG